MEAAKKDLSSRLTKFSLVIFLPIMQPSFVQRANTPFLHPGRMTSNSMYARFDKYPRPFNALELPPIEDTIAEFRLAQMIFQARMKARTGMASLVQYQCDRQQQLLPTTMSPILSAKPQHHGPTFHSAIPRRVSLTYDDICDVPGRQPMSERSESISSVRSSSVSIPPHGKIYVDNIRESDVLCGRGGRSNHHPGNKRYRRVISEMRYMYRNTAAKSNKTDLSRAIVDHVCQYGGRFIKKEESSGRYYVLTRGEARKKTSQALREAKTLKWTE